MNKLVISAVVAATVLIAGIFAFMPVEKASTVHLSILAGQRSADTLLLDTGGSVGPADVTVLAGATTTRIVMLYDGLGNASPADLEINTDILTVNPPTETDVDGDCTVTVEIQENPSLGTGFTVVAMAFLAEIGADHGDVTTQGLRISVTAADVGGANGCTVIFDGGQYVNTSIVGV